MVDFGALALAIATMDVALLFYALGILTGRRIYRKAEEKKQGKHRAD